MPYEQEKITPAIQTEIAKQFKQDLAKLMQASLARVMPGEKISFSRLRKEIGPESLEYRYSLDPGHKIVSEIFYRHPVGNALIVHKYADEEAKRRNTGINSIDIYDIHGHLLLAIKMDNFYAANTSLPYISAVKEYGSVEIPVIQNRVVSSKAEQRLRSIDRKEHRELKTKLRAVDQDTGFEHPSSNKQSTSKPSQEIVAKKYILLKETEYRQPTAQRLPLERLRTQEWEHSAGGGRRRTQFQVSGARSETVFNTTGKEISLTSYNAENKIVKSKGEEEINKNRKNSVRKKAARYLPASVKRNNLLNEVATAELKNAEHDVECSEKPSISEQSNPVIAEKLWEERIKELPETSPTSLPRK